MSNISRDEIDRIVQNEKEWRTWLIEHVEKVDSKIEKVDKELQTFKIRVFVFASLFGGGAGVSVNVLKKFLLGD